MREPVIVVNDPVKVAILDALMDGEKSRAELERRFGRRPTARCLDSFRDESKGIFHACWEYLKDPLRHDLEFIQTLFGGGSKQRKTMLRISEQIEVRKAPGGTRIIIVKNGENQ